MKFPTLPIKTARFGPAAMLILALLGGVLVVLVTPLGLGLREDSWQFATAAESLAAGTGLGRQAADGRFRPLTHFPPLFPAILGAFRLVGWQVQESARAIDAIAFSSVMALLAFAVYRLTRSWAAALVGGLVVITSTDLIQTFTWLQSEPVYLVLSLSGLLLLDLQLSTQRGRRLAMVAGLAFGLAWLTRYMGVALLLPALWFAIQSKDDPPLFRMTFLAVIAGPIGYFTVSNFVRTGNAVDRPIPHWHPPEADVWNEGARSALSWFLPSNIVDSLHGASAVLALGIAALATLFLAIRVLRIRSGATATAPRSMLAFLLSLYFFGHLVVVILTVLLFDRLTPLNSRILIPLYVSGLPLIVAIIYLCIQRLPRTAGLLLAFAVVSMLLFRTLGSVAWARDIRWAGQGLASRAWRTSPTLQYLRTAPPSAIFSNDLPAIYFHLGVNAYGLPSRNSHTDGSPLLAYGAERDAMLHSLSDGAVIVILGSDPSSRLEAALPPDARNGIVLMAEFKDGIVLHQP